MSNDKTNDMKTLIEKHFIEQYTSRKRSKAEYLNDIKKRRKMRYNVDDICELKRRVYPKLSSFEIRGLTMLQPENIERWN